ncbi:MAG: nicotinate-nucleotide adenylyltransferase [Gammaproteobacteria bacterium]
MKPIGILGGTFDPIHNGHLRLAIESYEQLDLEEVRLIPLNIPPHRNTPHASPEQRLEMMEIALHKLSGLVIDDCELHREGPSYTIDTVSVARDKVGDTPICLLMGMDAFNTISSWHRWEELLDQVHIVIADRPADDIAKDPNITVFLNRHHVDDISKLHKAPAGNIFKIDIPMLDISASKIKNIISSDKDASYLLPGNVLDFIKTNNLYQQNT